MVGVDAAGSGVVSQAGGVLLAETVRAVGLDRWLSAALAPWRKPAAVHDPAKVVCDLAVALALGGDCLADIGLLRAEPGVYGLVASDPTVSRTVDVLAADAPRAGGDRGVSGAGPGDGVAAGGPACSRPWGGCRAAAGDRRGRHVGDRAFGEGAGRADVQAGVRVSSSVGVPRPRPGRDRGAAGVSAAGRERRVEHGGGHIAVVRAALRQLPGHRPGTCPERVLVRTDAAGG